MTRAVVLLSGGKDSTIALWWCLDKGYDTVALSILHPTRPDGEVSAARCLAKAAGIEVHEPSLPFMFPVRELMPESDAPYVTRTAYMPMRNLMLYGVAGYFAETLGCNVVVGGQLKSDGEAYADAKRSFFDLLEGVYYETLSGSFLARHTEELSIVLPLIGLADEEAIALGRKLNAPLELSWSCLENGPRPCGKCVSCLDRIRAMSS